MEKRGSLNSKEIENLRRGSLISNNAEEIFKKFNIGKNSNNQKGNNNNNLEENYENENGEKLIYQRRDSNPLSNYNSKN